MQTPGQPLDSSMIGMEQDIGEMNNSLMALDSGNQEQYAEYATLGNNNDKSIVEMNQNDMSLLGSSFVNTSAVYYQ